MSAFDELADSDQRVRGTLITQLKSKRYNPALYWIVMLSTSTAGTTMSDFMDRTPGAGLRSRLGHPGGDSAGDFLGLVLE